MDVRSFKSRKYADLQHAYETDPLRFELTMRPFENAVMASWDAVEMLNRERSRLLQRYGNHNIEVFEEVLRLNKRRLEIFKSISASYAALDFGRAPTLTCLPVSPCTGKRPREDIQWLVHIERDQIYALNFPAQELVVSTALDLDPESRMTYFDRSFVLTGGTKFSSLCLQFYTDFSLRTMLPALPIGRSKHAAIVFRGDLYLVGGKQGAYGIDSVIALKITSEHYYDASSQHLPGSSPANPSTHYRWTICSSLRQARFDCSAVVMKDRIYVVGGLQSSVIQLKKPSKQANAISDMTATLVEVFDGSTWDNFPIKSPGFVLTALLPSPSSDNLLIFGGAITNKRKSGSYYYELDVKKRVMRRRMSVLNTDLVFKSSSVSVDGSSYCLMLKNLLIVSGRDVRLHKFL
jgi:hypothetical protein